MKLYHFTSVKSFKKIWETQSLKFADSKKTNDIFEKKKILQVTNLIFPEAYKSASHKVSFIKHFYDILFEYRQISLTMDYDDVAGYASPMMWGQYANHTRGICIELDTEKLNLNLNDVWSSKVVYTNHLPYINFDNTVLLNDDDIRNYIIEHRDDIFFKKHFHWTYENEYRIISNKESFLSIHGAINAIYLPDCKGYAFHVVDGLINGSGVKLKYLFPKPSNEGLKLSYLDAEVVRNCKKSNKN